VIGGTCLTTASHKASVRSDASRTVGISTTSLSAPTGMIVRRVLVQDGQRIRAGQVVMELDDSDYVASSKGWEAQRVAAEKEVEYRQHVLQPNKQVRDLDLAKAEAEFNFRTVDLDVRKRIRKATEDLYRTRASTQYDVLNTISKEQEAEYSLAVAKSGLVRARVSLTIGELTDRYTLAAAIAKRDEASAGLDLVRGSIASCRLTSPIDGFVGKVDIEPGQIVQSGVPLIGILGLDPVWVCMDFPQERIGELALGDAAEVVLDSFPKETFKGKVVAALAEVNPHTRVLPVYIEIRNPGDRIKAGISGFARISATEKAVTVPSIAVMQDDHRARVFCVRNGRAKIHEIRTGPLLENGVLEVQSGLSPGDEVINFGLVGLQDGDRVDTDWHKWAMRE
jgi:multidrug efflux pump subunit AcrA (membrane-fusion protein)